MRDLERKLRSAKAKGDDEVKFTETKLAGAYTVDIERREDSRGYFARIFCEEQFAAHGLTPNVAQASISFNLKRGTVRGLHFQYPPKSETKYVRCTKGAVFDIIVDLRPESPTYLEHVSFVLSAENGRGLYVPERFGHGFETIEDNTELTYYIGMPHAPTMEGGLMYNDPMLNILLPIPVSVISERDNRWRPLVEFEEEFRRRMSAKIANSA